MNPTLARTGDLGVASRMVRHRQGCGVFAVGQTFRHAMLIGILSLAGIPAAAAQVWRNITPDGPRPQARRGSAVALDVAHDRLLVHGGQAGTSEFLDDMWEFDLSTHSWHELEGLDPSPGPRCHHAGIVDPLRQRLVVFAGFPGRWNDTWIFDLETNSWTDVSGEVRPQGRCLHRAVHDRKRDRMIIYGGFSTNLLDDMWALDLETLTWSEIVPRSTQTPGIRYSYVMVADPARDRLVLYSGADDLFSVNDIADMWEFDLSTEIWRRIDFTTLSGRRATLNPGGRQDPAFDFIDDRHVLVSGGHRGRDGGTMLADTWVLDLDTDRWTRLGTGAPARWRSAAGFDLRRGLFVVALGHDESRDVYLDDVWALPLPFAASTPQSSRRLR